MSSTAAVVPRAPGGPLAPSHLVGQARSYAAASRSEATRRAYRRDFAAFVAWCDEGGLQALRATPDTVALYLTARAQKGAMVSSIERALVAISQAHKAAGLPSPRSSDVVAAVIKGIRRTLGVAPKQVAPVVVGELRAMLDSLPGDLRGARDRAMLLLGFAGAFRRSELVALDVQDLAFTDDGIEVTLRRSKTDQEGEGRKVGIPFGSSPKTCPVRAVKAWMVMAGVEAGPLFRVITRGGRLESGRASDQAVARAVKRAARRVGIDPATVSGHSLRAGLATSAAKAGKSERAIMAQTGHRSAAMVRRYIRDADLFSENAAAGLL